MNIITNCKISAVRGRQIFDSRGMPTVEAIVFLECGACGVASVPSGASRGKNEALELRDHAQTYNGNSVFGAVSNINDRIAKAVINKHADNQYLIDDILRCTDGSENKSVLGANAILAVSIACAKAAANAYSIPLYRYIGGTYARVLPIPLMNILNGGAHASNNLDIQEFMIVPMGVCMTDAMKMGSEIYFSLKKLLKSDNMSVSIGDEGGFSPSLSDNEAAIEYIVNAIEQAGYKPEKDVAIALDIAASEWYSNGIYHLPKQNTDLTANELLEYYRRLVSAYPIVSIEDPFHEEDWDSFARICKVCPDTQIVGDDLFVTNPSRLKTGIEKNSANAILIKPNQIGTVSETLETMHIASQNSYNAVVSHRSGDTDDSFIADLAVGTNAGQIKTGAPARGERISKYNRLLQIEESLGKSAVFGLFS